MKATLPCVAAAILMASIGCGSIFGYNRPVILTVTEINAPTVVAAGSSFSARLTVQTGGCLSFDYIDTDRTQSVANITVWGRDAGGKGVSCPADIRYESYTVQFSPPFASTFTIRVGSGTMNPLTAIVEIR